MAHASSLDGVTLSEPSNMALDNQLPPLKYSLRDRKRSIAIAWTLIVFDSCIIAVVLFYPLWFASKLSHSNVMAIVTGAVGAISLLQWVWRIYLLLLKKDTYRPIGSRRGYFDTFTWAYTACVIVIVVELVVGTIFTNPIVRLCSMPVPSLLFVAAGIEFLGTLGYVFDVRLPFRNSSLAKGQLSRPGVYTIIEDIVAVEGGGGREFREELDKRYQASPEFRTMLMKLSFFWSLPALLIAGGTTAVIWTVPATVAFGVGWCVPFVWAGVWTIVTFMWVPRMLKYEKEAWQYRQSSAVKA